MKRRWLLAVCALLMSTTTLAAKLTPVTVFAAASLKESLDAIAADWTRSSGQPVAISFAGSSALARQIEAGAPAEVFISADAEWMDYLQQRQLIDPTSRFDLVGNALVVIAPASSRLHELAPDPSSWQQALGDGRLAIAEVASVPAGRYAQQSLAKLGLWSVVAEQLAPADSVRAAMAFVALGEAPLGVVYATDAIAEPKVRVVARLDNATHEAIVYPVARVSTAADANVRGFLAHLSAPAARMVFADAGFRLL
jgi:molybdate transport system substrate-binding protein